MTDINNKQQLLIVIVTIIIFLNTFFIVIIFFNSILFKTIISLSLRPLFFFLIIAKFRLCEFQVSEAD